MIALGVQFPAAVTAAFPAAAAPAGDPELFTNAAAFVDMLQQLTGRLAPEGAAVAASGADPAAVSSDLSHESGDLADINPGAVAIVAERVRPPDLALPIPAAVAGSERRDTDVPTSSESAPRDKGDDADPGAATSVFPLGMLRQIPGVAIPIVPGPGASMSERRPVDGPAGAPDAFPISMSRRSSAVSTASAWEAAALDESQTGIPPQASGRAIQDQAARVSTAVSTVTPTVVSTVTPTVAPTVAPTPQASTVAPTALPSGVPTVAFTETAQVTPAISPGNTISASVVAGLIESDSAAAPTPRADIPSAVLTGEAPVGGRTWPGGRVSRPAPTEQLPEDERRLPADGRPGINADRVDPATRASTPDPWSGETPHRWPSLTSVRERPGAAPVWGLTGESRLLAAALTTGLAAPVSERPVGETELARQVVHSIRLQAMAGGGEAQVRLRPDYLGELTVAVKVERGVVSASLHAETPAVRQFIEANEASLRQALAEHGLHLDKLTILDEAPQPKSADQERRGQAREEQPRQQSPRRPRPEAESATFEVVV